MKPTPGPYRIDDSLILLSLEHEHKPIAIARFLDGRTGYEQARANAEAWIAGVAAIEKLERIRQIIECPPMGENLRMIRRKIAKILDEP